MNPKPAAAPSKFNIKADHPAHAATRSTVTEAVDRYSVHRQWWFSNSGDSSEVIGSEEKMHVQDDFRWQGRGATTRGGHSSIVGVEKFSNFTTNGQHRASAAGQGKTAYVAGLPQDTSKEELMNFFCELSVQSVCLSRDKATGELRGFAFVEFTDELSFQQALAYHGSQLRPGCCPISITVARPKLTTDQHVRGLSRGRGRGLLSAPARGRGHGGSAAYQPLPYSRGRGRGWGHEQGGHRGAYGGLASGSPHHATGAASERPDKSYKPANRSSGPSFDAGDYRSTWAQSDCTQEDRAWPRVVALVSPCDGCGESKDEVACNCSCSCCRKGRPSLPVTAHKRQSPQGKLWRILVFLVRGAFETLRKRAAADLVRQRCA